MRKVTYILKSFPVLSQTFVIDQINNLIANGYDVRIVSLTQEKIDEKLQSSIARFNLLERTEFINAGRSKLGKMMRLSLVAAYSFLNLFRAKSVISLALHLLKANDYKNAINTLRLFHFLSCETQLPDEYREGVFVAHFGQFGVITQSVSTSFANSFKSL